jgi:hypothetical protein
MKKGMGWVWLVAAPLSVASSIALAGAFEGPDGTMAPLQWQGFSNGYVNGSFSTDSGQSYSPISAGQFYGLFDGDNTGLDTSDFFRFFCMETGQFVDQVNANLYTRLQGPPGLSTTTIAELSQLFNNHYPHPELATYYTNAPTDFGSFADANSSAAFQLALLEIVFENPADPLDLSTGTFRANADSAVLQLATADLAGIGTSSTLAPGWTFFAFTNDSLQNFISAETTPALLQLTAPEPGTLLLVGIASLALLTAMRRRRIA